MKKYEPNEITKIILTALNFSMINDNGDINVEALWEMQELYTHIVEGNMNVSLKSRDE